MSDENLGLHLKPGDKHYRAYVGPPQDYDLISAMVFNLLTTLGCRQHHKVLDIGCGSLRNGRLLVPYLNKGNYTGIDPNSWLIEEGIKYEIGKDQTRIKDPILIKGATAMNLPQNATFDFVFAQSIFSHCGLDLIQKWLSDVLPHLEKNGVFLATFIKSNQDFEGQGWVYPGCVTFKPDTISELAKKTGYGFKELNWWHPRQTWCLFYQESFDVSWILDDTLNWNDAMQRNNSVK